MDKPPFGFRQDAEEKPEPEEGESQQEINCTSVHESKAWSPAAFVPAQPNDVRTWRRG